MGTRTVRTGVLAIAAFGLSVALAVAADASGVWRGEVSLPTGQKLPFVARLTQDGTKITGKLDGIGGAPDVPVVDGKIADNVITFSGTRQINGAAVKFNYTATFRDDNTLEFRIVRDDGSAAPLSSLTTRSSD